MYNMNLKRRGIGRDASPFFLFTKSDYWIIFSAVTMLSPEFSSYICLVKLQNCSIMSKLSIKQWAEEDRPREKLLLKGVATLPTLS